MNKFCDNNPKLLNDFLNYLKGILGYSQFFEFIRQYYKLKIEVKNFNIIVFLEIKEADIIAFLVYLNFNRDNNPTTRQRKLYAIRRFYKWLLTNNPSIKKENPTKKISNIQKVERLPKYLSLENAKKIQTIFTRENSRNPIRDNTIITLFLSTGMRVGELINININDINFNKNSISIIGKGSKERTVYFSESCKNQLIKYLKFRSEKDYLKSIEPLFISCRHKRLGIDGIEDVCSKAYRLMGLENYGYTTHTLRHTAATLMYMYVSQDILLLKQFLGHAQLSTTQIYTHVYNQQVKEAVNKNPLNEIYRKKAA